jgi:tRNA G18 (ribose-2'-O)-methylase SpoU
VSNENKKVYPVQELADLMIQDNQDKILIILGSEGYGVSDHLRKYSDYNIMI